MRRASGLRSSLLISSKPDVLRQINADKNFRLSPITSTCETAGPAVKKERSLYISGVNYDINDLYLILPVDFLLSKLVLRFRLQQ